MSQPRWLHHCVVLAGLSGLIVALAGAEARAAIAPQYERVRQFGFAMQAANEAAAKLYKHGPIESLERTGDGTFRFRAGRCFVPVNLEHVPVRPERPVVGAPNQYKVSLGDVTCD